MSAGRNMVSELVDEWTALRVEAQAFERAEHPDVTDVLGRVWTWKSGDIYTHDGMAWPLAFITSPTLQGPSAAALDNPNYRWCLICKPSYEGAKRVADRLNRAEVAA